MIKLDIKLQISSIWAEADRGGFAGGAGPQDKGDCDERHAGTPVGAVGAERLGRARVFTAWGLITAATGRARWPRRATSWLDVRRVVSEIAESDLRDADKEHDRVDYGRWPP